MKIKIEKMIYGGDGLGRLPADSEGRSKTVFVPFVLPGETVEAEETEQKPGFSRAKLQQVLEPATTRVKPGCPYFERCGGCHYQHTSYEEQLKIKESILREALVRGAKLELPVELKIHSAEPWQYRNRVRLKVATAPEFALGYYKHRSHDLLPVKACPISSPMIQQGITALWEAGEKGEVPAAVREVQLFASHDDRTMLLELYVSRDLEKSAFERMSAAVRERLPAIVGVTAFEAARNVNESDTTGEAETPGRGILFTAGATALAYEVAGNKFRVSAGSFFQTNRFLIDELVKTALGDSKGKIAFDLYAGAGLFSLPLAKRFEQVTAVEASPFSSADLVANVPGNVKPTRANTEIFLRDWRRAPLDLVVVDPPRSGLGERTAQMLGRMHVSRVTYVSCDPSTLSRDLRVLLQSGFRVEQAHLVDLFPQTYHMESVFHLVR